MIGLFFASVLVGLVASAPFGAAGAMVADAALVYDRKRMNATILAAVSADSILAFFISLMSSPAKIFFQEYEKLFFTISGVVIIMLGVFLWKVAALPDLAVGRKTGPIVVFFTSLLHPGSVATFLLITALFSVKFLAFKDHRLIFAGGIMTGSFCVFSTVGVLFWMLHKRAEKFVNRLRCGLALMLGAAGTYLLVKGF